MHLIHGQLATSRNVALNTSASGYVSFNRKHEEATAFHGASCQRVDWTSSGM
jgi:hypothetical protein